MVTYGLWPLIVALIGVGVWVRDFFGACTSGLFVSLCGLGTLAFVILLIQSLGVYAVGVALWKRWSRTRKRKVLWYHNLLIGVGSFVLVTGGVLVPAESLVPVDIFLPLRYASYPFLVVTWFILGVIMS